LRRFLDVAKMTKEKDLIHAEDEKQSGSSQKIS